MVPSPAIEHNGRQSAQNLLINLKSIIIGKKTRSSSNISHSLAPSNPSSTLRWIDKYSLSHAIYRVTSFKEPHLAMLKLSINESIYANQRCVRVIRKLIGSVRRHASHPKMESFVSAEVKRRLSGNPLHSLGGTYLLVFSFE